MVDTTQTQGLVVAYQLDGTGRGERLDWAGVDSGQRREGFVWIHLDCQNPHAQGWLRNHSGLDEVAVEGLLAGETRPRCVAVGSGLLIFLRGVNLNPGADPDDMVAIRIWIEPDRVITSRRRRLLSVDDLRAAIDRGQGPCTPGDLLVDLSGRMVTRMADVIEHIDEEVDRLEDEVLTGENPRLQMELAMIRRQVISLRRYLAPQREAMSRLQIERAALFTDVDRIRLREVTDQVIRYLEDLESVRDRAAVIQEELANRLATQLNSRMYMLSLVAAVFLPLGFLTGLLGINVGGIPGAENPLAFLMVSSALIFLVLFQVWLFRRRRWL